MRKYFLPTVAAVMVLLSGGFATAGSALGLMAAVHNCQNAQLPAETRIEACTEAIHTNLTSHGILAAFYFNRAVAYEHVNDFDRARQDYDKALELKPNFARAQANRTRLAEQHPANAAPPPGEVH